MSERIEFDLAGSIGFEHVGSLDMSSLVFREDVRRMCASGRCERYGTSWSCPPRIGSLERISERARRYSRGIIVQTVGRMEDRFDLKAIADTEKVHKKRFFDLVRQMRAEIGDILPMASGSCTLCRKCTYPDRPCRHPEMVFPSMEAYGLLVRDVCEGSGLEYNYGRNSMTFTSLILY